MSNHPTSFAEWQSYPSTIDPIHVSWLKNAKKSKTAFEGFFYSQKKLKNIVLNRMLAYFCLVVVVAQ